MPQILFLILVMLTIGQATLSKPTKAPEFFGGEKGWILNPPEHGSRAALEKFFTHFGTAQVVEATHGADRCLVLKYNPYSLRKTHYCYFYAFQADAFPERQYEFRIFQKINGLGVGRVSVAETDDGWKISCQSGPTLIIPYKPLCL